MENQNMQDTIQNQERDTNNNIAKNEIQTAVSNALNNPFLIASLTNSVMMNLNINGPFQIPKKNLSNSISGPYESYKTNLISKDRLKQKRSATGSSDEEIIMMDSEQIDKDKEKKKNKSKETKKEKKEEKQKTKNNNKESKNDDYKEGIYNYTDDNLNNRLYSYHKISSDGTFLHLRCKDRNCTGTAKYIFEEDNIIVTKECSIDYKKHNYIIEDIIKQKILKNDVTNDEMKDYLFQKIYFMETHAQYPSLTYNQILLGMLDKYKLKKVSFTNKNFNVCKNNYQKKIYGNENINDKLDNIKLKGKRLLNCKLTYIDLNDKNIEKYFRIYGTQNSMSLLNSKNISQYFTDCTYKCLPNELKGECSLLVLLGYDYQMDKFRLILIAILSHESADIYTEFYNFLKNTYLFKPKKITFDFALGNIGGIKTVFEQNEDVLILPCLFHLSQAWWRKAAN